MQTRFPMHDDEDVAAADRRTWLEEGTIEIKKGLSNTTKKRMYLARFFFYCLSNNLFFVFSAV
jgi:hypothetical protein